MDHIIYDVGIPVNLKKKEPQQQPKLKIQRNNLLAKYLNDVRKTEQKIADFPCTKEQDET